MSVSSQAPDTVLGLALARAGLIQFGRFVQPDGAIWPLAARLVWLPSYPALLRDVAAALHPLLQSFQVDRVLTTAEALPIGVALGLRSDVPVVYPIGGARDQPAAFVIEGAYDVGHPTLLLADVLVDGRQAQALAVLAGRVGLDVHNVLAVLDLGLGAREALDTLGYTVRCVLALRDLLPALEGAGLLPPVMRVTVERWMAVGRGD